MSFRTRGEVFGPMESMTCCVKSGSNRVVPPTPFMSGFRPVEGSVVDGDILPGEKQELQEYDREL